MIDIEEAGTQEDMLRYAQMRSIIEHRQPAPAGYLVKVMNDMCESVQRIVAIIEESDDQQVVTPSDGSEPVTTYGISPKLAQRLVSEQTGFIHMLVGVVEGHAIANGISREDPQFQLLEQMMRAHSMQAWFVKLS
jgi:hypothetical protein